jgi:hypothetical protein
MMRTFPHTRGAKDMFDPRHGHDGLPIEEEEYA